MSTNSTRPRVYVGTYAKYNAGRLAGKWIDLDDYTDADDLLTDLAELHADESDPEFMCQDWEGVPSGLAAECPDWDQVLAWVNLDEDDREVLDAWTSYGREFDIDAAREAYQGTQESLAEYVEEFWRDCGGFEEAGGNQWWHPTRYIDWERMAKDLEMSGDVFTVETDEGVMVFDATR